MPAGSTSALGSSVGFVPNATPSSRGVARIESPREGVDKAGGTSPASAANVGCSAKDGVGICGGESKPSSISASTKSAVVDSSPSSDTCPSSVVRSGEGERDTVSGLVTRRRDGESMDSSETLSSMDSRLGSDSISNEPSALASAE